jgi:hypothetical protein
MPTLEHNAIVEMFRENPELTPPLLARLFHVNAPPHAAVTTWAAENIDLAWAREHQAAGRRSDGRARGDGPRRGEALHHGM